jgi:hypothetical protein
VTEDQNAHEQTDEDAPTPTEDPQANTTTIPPDEQPEAGNPTEPQMGTVADVDTSQVDDVIAQVADEHEDAPAPVSVAEQPDVSEAQ